MAAMSIETYFHKGEGYNPFLIREGWQVAQLNHVATHGLNDIVDVERHANTDEVFILFKGKAVLISASFDTAELKFEYLAMKQGVTYNVPAGLWHNIAMSRDCQIMIIEKDNTHNNDVEHKTLSQKQLQEAYRRIAQVADCALI